MDFEQMKNKFTDQLFIVSNSTFGNSWLYLDYLHIEIYIRIIKRYIDGKYIKTIEIGNIKVDEEYRKKGNCTLFFNLLENIARDMNRMIMVESVQNSILEKMLVKRKYKILDETATIKSYIKKM